jgi:hypothetical protein
MPDVEIIGLRKFVPAGWFRVLKYFKSPLFWLFENGERGFWNAFEEGLATIFNGSTIPGIGDPIGRADNLANNVRAGVLTGQANSFFSTPDSAALDITGSQNWVIGVQLASYASGAAQIIAAKWVTTGNQRSFYFAISSTGIPTIVTSTDGTAGTIVTSATVASLTTILSAYQHAWIRPRLVVNDGSGNRIVRIDYSLQPRSTAPEDINWTLFEERTIAGATTVFAGTAP